jgi:hypothetical protein
MDLPRPHGSSPDPRHPASARRRRDPAPSSRLRARSVPIYPTLPSIRRQLRVIGPPYFDSAPRLDPATFGLAGDTSPLFSLDAWTQPRSNLGPAQTLGLGTSDLIRPGFTTVSFWLSSWRPLSPPTLTLSPSPLPPPASLHLTSPQPTPPFRIPLSPPVSVQWVPSQPLAPPQALTRAPPLPRALTLRSTLPPSQTG